MATTERARVAQAAAPLAFGNLLERLGAGSLWITGSLGARAGAAPMLLPQARPAVLAKVTT